MVVRDGWGEGGKHVPLAAVLDAPDGEAQGGAVGLAVGNGHGGVVDDGVAGEGARGDLGVAAVVGLREGGGHEGREGEEALHLGETGVRPVEGAEQKRLAELLDDEMEREDDNIEGRGSIYIRENGLWRSASHVPMSRALCL